LRVLYGDRYEAYSAGIQPTEVNPYVIRVMAEIGIDISDHRSKSVDEFLNEEFDYVITVCDTPKRHAPSSQEVRDTSTGDSTIPRASTDQMMKNSISSGG